MDNIQIIIWLFPSLFIFHDFEEIIFMKVWLNKNKPYLYSRFPRLAKMLMPHFDKLTTPAFALGIAEHFIILLAVTVISYLTNWYSLWMGLFIAFTLHLIVHCLQALIVRKYVPVIVTSVICLPVCIYLIKQTIHLFALSNIIWYSILGIIIVIINGFIMHKSMERFSKFLSYE